MFQPFQAMRVEKMRFFDIRIAFSICLVLWSCSTEAQHGGMDGDSKFCYLFSCLQANLSFLDFSDICWFQGFPGFSSILQHWDST